MPALERLIDMPDAQNIVVVTHGRLLRILLAYATQQSLDNMGRIRHHNTSINVLDALPLDGVNDVLPYRHSSHIINEVDGRPEYKSIQTNPAPEPMPSLRSDYQWIPWVLDDTLHVQDLVMRR